MEQKVINRLKKVAEELDGSAKFTGTIYDYLRWCCKKNHGSIDELGLSPELIEQMQNKSCSFYRAKKKWEKRNGKWEMVR